MLIATQLIGFGSSSGPNEVLFTQSSNITTGANAFTLMGSPSGVGTYRFVVASGITLSSTSTATPALTVGAFPAGSIVIIENNGTIVGCGGGGGGGSTPGNFGSPGGAGGPAMSLSTGYTVRIDNTLGNIWGGGGGGGGGSGTGNSWGPNTNGGSGGTGAGLSAATAGSGGACGAHPDYNYEVYCGGSGGAGGARGAAGSAGSAGAFGGATPGSGGAAGKAINLNGNTVTWLGGNTVDKVKGAVS